MHAFGPLDGTFRATFHGWDVLDLLGRLKPSTTERPARLH
jgi:hypothetical protein